MKDCFQEMSAVTEEMNIVNEEKRKFSREMKDCFQEMSVVTEEIDIVTEEIETDSWEMTIFN